MPSETQQPQPVQSPHAPRPMGAMPASAAPAGMAPMGYTEASGGAAPAPADGGAAPAPAGAAPADGGAAASGGAAPVGVPADTPASASPETDATPADTTPQPISDAALAQVLAFQQNEVTEAAVYRRIAKRTKDAANRETLLRIADEEMQHARMWERYTRRCLLPQRGIVRRYALIARLLGFTFAVKLMERGEKKAQLSYDDLAREVPEAISIRNDEEAHEAALLDMLDEERLDYVGSMVLGMNDAMVEMTGTLAGLTLAMQNTRLIALSGLITGIAATLSMASSEYLSAKSEGRPDALKSATYTGVTYLVTVALLILPYLLFDASHYLWALGTMVLIVLAILVVFNYYLSVAQDLSFKKRFGQMAGISLGVAALSFVIGLLVKQFLGVDI